MKKLLFVLFLLIPLTASAATYYVRPLGNDSHPGTTNSDEAAWQHIDYAMDTAVAGDTIRVQVGTYAEIPTPGHNGSAVGGTITVVADGVVTTCGMDLTSNSYIRIIGIVFDGNGTSCGTRRYGVTFSGTNSYLEFWNNTFRDMGQYGLYTVYYAARLNNSVVIGNTFTNIGMTGGYAGSGIGISTQGSNNLFAYNEVSSIYPDAFYVEGHVSNRYLNNYAHDLTSTTDGHSDMWQGGSSDLGWSDNLYEANLQMSGAQTHEHTTNISHGQAASRCHPTCGTMAENVFRRNIFHNLGSGTIAVNQAYDGPIDDTRTYNNDFIYAEQYVDNTSVGYHLTLQQNSGAYAPSGTFNNNLNYEGWGATATANLSVFVIQGTYTANYNLAYDANGTVSFAAGWTSQANEQSNANPELTNVATHDFTISNTGAAYQTGGPLTVTVGAGTGTTFNVTSNTGGFFRGDNTNLSQYSGALVTGDTITVGTDVLTVSSISGDAITVTSSFTWADGDPVYYGGSATPDIGALPYNATGYALTATFANAAGTVTVTPSDANLVRFVVCYEQGIPTGVDNSSPYTCTVTSGDLDIRVYPLYASTTLYATATEEGGGDTTAPVVAFTTPTSDATYATSTGNLAIGGTASDAVGVSTVNWVNDRGGSGACTGTTDWSATINPSLQSGVNVLTVTACDAAANCGNDTLTVTYTPPAPAGDGTGSSLRIR